jgi:hypothetical protein
MVYFFISKREDSCQQCCRSESGPFWPVMDLTPNQGVWAGFGSGSGSLFYEYIHTEFPAIISWCKKLVPHLYPIYGSELFEDGIGRNLSGVAVLSSVDVTFTFFFLTFYCLRRGL